MYRSLGRRCMAITTKLMHRSVAFGTMYAHMPRQAHVHGSKINDLYKLMWHSPIWVESGSRRPQGCSGSDLYLGPVTLQSFYVSSLGSCTFAGFLPGFRARCGTDTGVSKNPILGASHLSSPFSGIVAAVGVALGFCISRCQS